MMLLSVALSLAGFVLFVTVVDGGSTGLTAFAVGMMLLGLALDGYAIAQESGRRERRGTKEAETR